MEIDFQVIRRYWEGKEIDGDTDQIIDWFSDLRFEHDLRKKYRLLWDELDDDKDTEDCDGSVILGRIYHKIKNEEYQKRPQKKGMVRILNIITKVAAILFIPMLAYLWVVKGSDILTHTQTSSKIYSPLGTRSMFSLPDGSTGWLNGGSHLEFPAEFKGKSREVYLEGEAYFDVLSDAKKPFIVNGKQKSVIAHGTTFNVHAYPEDPTMQVTLLKGSVGIYERKNGRLINLADLKPGQMYISYPGTGLNRIENVDADKVVCWKDGMLTFRDEPFSEVVKKINRWYNVDIQIMDEALSSDPYLGTFIDETLDEVLSLLTITSPTLQIKDLGRERKDDGTFEKRKIEFYYKRTK
jgi:ferric-dicitrate binding protein FerR (iron transport regulator)